MGLRGNINLTPFDLGAQIEEAQQFGEFDPVLRKGRPTGEKIQRFKLGAAAMQPVMTAINAGFHKGKISQGELTAAKDFLHENREFTSGPERSKAIMFLKNLMTKSGVSPHSAQQMFQLHTGVDERVFHDVMTADVMKDRDAFQQRLDKFGDINFNVGLNIERAGDADPVTTSFAQQIETRQSLLKNARAALQANFGKVFANFVEKDVRESAVKGVEPNALGRMQLVRRLRRQFGPGFSKVPAAARTLAQFDAILGQQSDISNINKLLNQGRTAMTFLKSQFAKETKNIDLPSRLPPQEEEAVA